MVRAVKDNRLKNTPPGPIPPVLPVSSSILLVDDDPIMREFAGAVLRTAGYDVREASDGGQAVDSARAQVPDLVVSDVIMGGGDGYAALEALRSSSATAHVPVVLMTSAADLSGMRRGMNLGADDYLAKPISADALLGVVANQLRKRKLARRQADAEMEALRKNLNRALPHEFNTPLNGIIGSAQLLKEEAAALSPAEISEMAGAILESGERLHRVARNYLAYAELEICAADPAQRSALAGESAPNAEEIATVIALAAAERFGRMADLRIDLPGFAVPMREDHWRRLVEELVTNAFQFSGAGTPVSLSAETSAHRLAFSVEDEGAGLSQEHLARIGAYAQFDRGIREQQGLGLGLAIVGRIVSLYDGELRWRSEPGRGTQVTVGLGV